MRYRATICVDIWADIREEAEEKAMDIISDIPNSFQVALSILPHGGNISLVQDDTQQG